MMRRYVLIHARLPSRSLGAGWCSCSQSLWWGGGLPALPTLAEVLRLILVGRLCQTPRRFTETPYNLFSLTALCDR
jgi:hypothetical protein